MKVTDHNDHEPKFMSAEFHGSVYETAAVGTSVVQVLAYDDDKGANAELKMSIISGTFENFGPRWSAYGRAQRMGIIKCEDSQQSIAERDFSREFVVCSASHSSSLDDHMVSSHANRRRTMFLIYSRRESVLI